MRVNAANAVNPAYLRQLGRIENTRAKDASAQQPPSQAPAVQTTGNSQALSAPPREWPGQAVGIQRIVESGRGVPAAPNSRVGAAIAQARAQETGSIETPSADAPLQSPLRYGDADLAYFNEAYGTRLGDAGFRAEYDFNADGVLNGADYGQLLGRYGEVKPTDTVVETDPQSATETGAFTLADAEALRAFWGAQEGEDGYTARLDLNSDGVLNGADYGLILGAVGAPARDPGLETPPADEADISPTDAATTPTDSPAIAEAVMLAEETLAAGEQGYALETRVLEASDLLRVLDGLREDSSAAAEASLPDRAKTLDSLRESLVASLLTPSRTDAISSLRTLLDRLAGV